MTEVLPTELWRKVIGYATDHDPPHRPDGIDGHGGYPAPPCNKESMHHKFTLSLVCKYFQSIMEEYLYEAIHVTDTRQHDSLLGHHNHYTDVLGRRRQYFARYTIYLRLELDFNMINKSDWDRYCRFILSCKNLQIFNFDYDDMPWTPGTFHPAQYIIDALPQTIRSLEWNLNTLNIVPDSELLYLLQMKPSIRTLKIGHTHENLLKPEIRSALEFEGTLCVENLTHLELFDTRDGFLAELRKHWRTPCLTHFTTVSFRNLDVPFPNITNLEITDTFALTSADVDPGELLHSFPNLIELRYSIDVQNPIRFFKERTGNTHPCIKKITMTLREAGLSRATDLVKDKEYQKLASYLRRTPLEAFPSLSVLVIRNTNVYGDSDNLRGLWKALESWTAFFRSKGVEMRLTI